jgi:hypothetical protein
MLVYLEDFDPCNTFVGYLVNEDSFSRKICLLVNPSVQREFPRLLLQHSPNQKALYVSK